MEEEHISISQQFSSDHMVALIEIRSSQGLVQAYSLGKHTNCTSAFIHRLWESRMPRTGFRMLASWELSWCGATPPLRREGAIQPP